MSILSYQTDVTFSDFEEISRVDSRVLLLDCMSWFALNSLRVPSLASFDVLLFQNGIEVRIAPFSFRAFVLSKISFPFHPWLLENMRRRQIVSVASCEQSMQLKFFEAEFDESSVDRIVWNARVSRRLTRRALWRLVSGATDSRPESPFPPIFVAGSISKKGNWWDLCFDS